MIFTEGFHKPVFEGLGFGGFRDGFRIGDMGPQKPLGVQVCLVFVFLGLGCGWEWGGGGVLGG